ncbi:OmpW/AlkL family protein [Acinetobacter nectaris]|uniref:OmpW/AlkL family protein n=1 Tax=Acinetobacter nectaris TaxID=1219382 RepID=UPI001F1AA0C3|nr:OmpW family outer membrane protein [Acinetobacter nectaris]MCF9034921.1 OmpW family protein [Acinetobacter nectaris]
MNKLTYMIAPVALALVSAAAHAETTDGKTIAVSAGWAHIMPQGSKQGVYSTSNNKLVSSTGFTSNAGFDLEKTNTAEFKIDYLVNDNVSLGLILGVPPRLDIKGEGSLLSGKLNLDKFSKVGDIKVYSPVITGKYHFGAVTNKFRPYIGAGLMYAHFSDLRLDSGIQNDPLLKATNGSITNVKVRDAIAPVAFLGADYNVNKDWFITASVSYVQLDTHASLNVSGKHPLAGSYNVQGDTKIEINPIVTYLGFGFRF